MLQQGQHRAVRGLLVEAQIMVLSATRYDGDPSPPMLDRRTDTAINPGNSGGPLVDSNCKACLSRNKLQRNETYVFGRKTYAEKWRNILHVNEMWWLKSVELQAVGVNTAIISGTAALFTMISCVMPSSIDYCPLLPHLKHPGHKGLLLRCHPTPYHLQLGYLFATQEFFTLDVTLRQQFVCEVVSQLMQFPGCNKAGLPNLAWCFFGSDS